MEQFTQRVFGLPSKEFFPKHSEILSSMRHLLVPGELQAHAVKLAAAVKERLPALLPHGKEVRACNACAEPWTVKRYAMPQREQCQYRN